MVSSLTVNSDFLKLLFEVIPVGILLADGNQDIKVINSEGNKMFCISSNQKVAQRLGEQLKCVNAQGKCGSSAACETCILRASVAAAIDGQSISRTKGKFSSYDGDSIKQYTLLITAKPFMYREESMALLVIEDLSLVTELNGLIPICSSCHHIRDDKGNWVYMGEYLRQHSEADLTHDYCPECVDRLRMLSCKAITG